MSLKKSFRPSDSLHTRLVRNIACLNGLPEGGFEASVTATGGIKVCGPTGSAHYPAEAWVSKFVRHLHRGYFERHFAKCSCSSASGNGIGP